MAEIRRKEKDRSATAKEESRGVVLEVLREMFLRGIQCLPVSIAASDVSIFRVEEGGVRPPLIAVEGLGEKAARRVGEELTKGDVATIDDLVARTGLSRPIVERLKGYKAFGDLPETNQLALF
jgi:DNA polymerase-3 subunit alpha (Gram-positive type)